MYQQGDHIDLEGYKGVVTSSEWVDSPDPRHRHLRLEVALPCWQTPPEAECARPGCDKTATHMTEPEGFPAAFYCHACARGVRDPEVADLCLIVSTA